MSLVNRRALDLLHRILRDPSARTSLGQALLNRGGVVRFEGKAYELRLSPGKAPYGEAV